MTKSNRRRSSAATPGAVVFASHCCGTTRPSGPIASRTTWIHARSRTKPRRASRPVRGHARAWSPRLSTIARQPFFFFSRTFLPQLLPRSLCSGAAQQGVPRQADAHPRWGMRLAAGPSSQRASARSSCKAGSGPAALTWASPGSSRSDAASAPCAATEMIPLHR